MYDCDFTFGILRLLFFFLVNVKSGLKHPLKRVEQTTHFISLLKTQSYDMEEKN